MKAGERIGDYEIISELGRGGMGRVYKVRNVISDRVEAMKILLPDLAGRQELVARFLREIKLVASLNHPNIGALRTALTLNDQLVMIMEYVEGTSLADRLEDGPLPIADVVTYTDQALQALSHAHKMGVVHRDIKPANMMVTPEGVLKVMDFGIAFSGSEHKLTSTGTTLGSLAYMSPEQVKGEGADLRSDLYSLGISLYEMVTGLRPFHADSDFAIMAAHVKEAPRPPMELQPGLPAGLNNIILLAIAKEKEDRFQSADAFRNALGSIGLPAAAAAAAGGRTVSFATPVPGATATHAPAVVESKHKKTTVGPIPAIPHPPPAAVQPAGGGYRGYYITLGVVLTLALLVAAGTYYKSGAAQSPASAKPAPVAEMQPPPQPAEEAKAGEPAPQATPAPERKALYVPTPGKPAPQTAELAEKQKPAEKPAEPDNSALLDELEDQLDKMSGRAAAVDTGLQTLQRQQRGAGYDLRGDISAKWESMRLNLDKAKQALRGGDPVRGKKYADQAETALGHLEKFLGR
jgi:serine/threonine-protein kinase